MVVQAEKEEDEEEDEAGSSAEGETGWGGTVKGGCAAST